MEVLGSVDQSQVGAACALEQWVDQQPSHKPITIEVRAYLVQVAVDVTPVKEPVLGINYKERFGTVSFVDQHVGPNTYLAFFVQVIMALCYYLQAIGAN